MHAFGRWGHPPLGISPCDGTTPQPQKQNLDGSIVDWDCSILHFWLSAIAKPGSNIIVVLVLVPEPPIFFRNFLLRTPNVLYLIEAHQANNIDNNLAENENPKHLPGVCLAPLLHKCFIKTILQFYGLQTVLRTPNCGGEESICVGLCVQQPSVSVKLLRATHFCTQVCIHTLPVVGSPYANVEY